MSFEILTRELDAAYRTLSESKKIDGMDLEITLLSANRKPEENRFLQYGIKNCRKPEENRSLQYGIKNCRS